MCFPTNGSLVSMFELSLSPSPLNKIQYLNEESLLSISDWLKYLEQKFLSGGGGWVGWAQKDFQSVSYSRHYNICTAYKYSL